jgi:endo-1,4-beta-xylanase
MSPIPFVIGKRSFERRRRHTSTAAWRALASVMILGAAACRRDGADVSGTGGNAGATGPGGVGGGGLDGAGGFAGVGGDSGNAGGAGEGGSAGVAAGSGGGSGGVAGTGNSVEAGVDAGAGGGGGSVAIAPGTALKDAAAKVGRLVGAAIGAPHLSDAAFAATAAADFNFVTPENEMKWDATEPSQNTFTFAAGDAIVAFAQHNGMQVKGHTLVWHAQLPAWVSNLGDATALHTAMINHITQVASHFRGQVVAWDVVNEAVADNGQALRNTVFNQYLGAGYIDDAFNAARAADPGALLFYNDYGAEGGGAKSDYIYSMVKGMLARGVPINGVGLQMHTGPADSPSAAQVAGNMQRLAALGLNVVISEMDVQLCTTGDLSTQSTRFHDIVADCVAQPLCLAVTVWGVPDKYSWLNGVNCATPHPLLFDDNYVPKPAHMGVWNAFNGL